MRTSQARAFDLHRLSSLYDLHLFTKGINSKLNFLGLKKNSLNKKIKKISGNNNRRKIIKAIYQ
jgi:hypothetical protein